MDNKQEELKRLDTFKSAIALISTLHGQPENKLEDFMLHYLFKNYPELQNEPLTEQLRVATNITIDWATATIKANYENPNLLRQKTPMDGFIV